MEGGPVYFIGGTFGGTGSVWTIVITAGITALLTFGTTIGASFLLEHRKRDLDRKALAASVLAEVDAVLRLFDELRMEDRYREVKANMERMFEASDPWPPMPDDALTFPTTVYEKSADRIGTLGPGVAADVVRFYNFLNGFRVTVRSALGPSDLPPAARLDALGFVLRMLATELPKAKALRAELLSRARERPQPGPR